MYTSREFNFTTLVEIVFFPQISCPYSKIPLLLKKAFRSAFLENDFYWEIFDPFLPLLDAEGYSKILRSQKLTFMVAVKQYACKYVASNLYLTPI